MITLKNLADIPFDSLFEAFNGAFADYDVRIDKAELENMLERRGYNPQLSFGAFDGDTLSAFTFNGTGSFEGLPTVYDTGTGTRKEYRGQGLAARIFEYSLPYLKEAGISQYLLEVLQHNTTAANIYRNLGFEVTREFNYFTQDKACVTPPSKAVPTGLDIRAADLAMQNDMTDFWDFNPSWQNSFESIRRRLADFTVLGAFFGDELAGYCIFAPRSGDITQLAVAHSHRRKGIASALLRLIVKDIDSAGLKMINTEVGCDSIDGFMEAADIPLAGRQFEMIKTL